MDDAERRAKRGPSVVACMECEFVRQAPTIGYALGEMNAHQRETGHQRIVVGPAEDFQPGEGERRL